MNDRPTPPVSPHSGLPPWFDPRTRYRGARRVAFGLSIAAHVVAVALYPSFFSGIPEADMDAGGFAQALVPPGTELVNIVELQPDQEEEPPTPEEVLEPEVEVVPVPVRPTGVVAPPGFEPPAGGPPGPTAAERIRPRRGDLRYWAPVDPSRAAPSREEVMRLQLIAELEALNDSAAIAAELERRATDWTYTDEEGKRWGVSPGQIHLGDLTLPMPFGFGTSAYDRERAEDRLWAWDEIERGAATGAVIKSWRERDKAIRERMNAERKPDTTRTGGGGG
ncbi:MAG: hypothetical protein HKO65_16555 [Gemmatimonadetes bacterium]|nr:hypothetical protein [Gemmatimonadota bacterium]NNM06707.1 hypothetical protein [Gemmatimonadota bacterium]